MTPVRAGPLGLLFACLALMGALFLWPLYARRPLVAAMRATCLSNVKQIDLGLMIYSGDWDDRLPQRDEWMDALVPYTKNPVLFHCPSAPKEAYGYAFNGALSQFDGKKLKDPAKTAMIYESVNPIRNASDLLASVPMRARHGAKPRGFNNFGFADGHAKAYPGGALP